MLFTGIFRVRIDFFDHIHVNDFEEVFPRKMSDITSGYNIARDIFPDHRFATLCGFREEEVAQTLADITADCGLPEERTREALEMMRTWYNGYRFVPEQIEPVYNPTMCLYFFDEF